MAAPSPFQLQGAFYNRRCRPGPSYVLPRSKRATSSLFRRLGAGWSKPQSGYVRFIQSRSLSGRSRESQSSRSNFLCAFDNLNSITGANSSVGLDGRCIQFGTRSGWCSDRARRARDTLTKIGFTFDWKRQYEKRNLQK
jgi:hypothetical protein